MREYLITTDNTGDLPKDYLARREVPTMWLPYFLDGETYRADNSLPDEEF